MSLFFTNVAYAGESLDVFILKVNNLIINPLILLLFALALAYFLWGIFQFLTNSTNEEKRTEGKKHMMYGILGLVIMMAVFMLMGVIIDTLGINTSGTNIDPENGTVILNTYTPTPPAGLLQ
ncbi:MAG: hypothetical protein NTZ44_01705 [Candidatus Nomurabacteria bacterium]|nr:hypothetical protein [Candidatus Nomurabacteria bacterium]